MSRRLTMMGEQLTVKELIELLMKVDENLPVEVWDGRGDSIPVVDVWEDVVEETAVLDISF